MITWRKQYRRGLTLIEVTLALSIAGVVFVAVAAWIEMVGAAAFVGSKQSEWRQSARAALRLIADDLVQGDFMRDDDRRRVTVMGESVLRIHTRSRGLGACTVEYYVTESDHLLERRVVSDDKSGNERRDRPVLGGVVRVTASIDEEGSSLLVTITGLDGERPSVVERRIQLKPAIDEESR